MAFKGSLLFCLALRCTAWSKPNQLGSSGEPGQAGVVISGRSAGWTFDWPGVTLLARVNASSLAVEFTDTGRNRFKLYVDGHPVGTVQTVPGRHNYSIFANLSLEVYHDVVLLKITEACGQMNSCTWADFGQVTFERFLDQHSGAPATLLLPQLPWRAGRHLEFIGDSITAGWGAEGGTDDSSCDAGENHATSWAAQLAGRLEAEHVATAWGGIGLVLNDQADTQPSGTAMPELWKRALGTDPTSTWNFSWVPSGVLVHLGTNDFCKHHNITRVGFKAAYLKLLHTVYATYRAPVFVACGPMGTGYFPYSGHFPCDIVAEVAIDATAQGLPTYYLDFSKLFKDPANVGGCGHPSVNGHLQMAAIAEPLVRKVLAWEAVPESYTMSV